MDYKEKATILRVCSSKKGERCSRCPAFGQGNQNCMRNAMKDGATAITDLLARAEAAEAENAALRKMQPIQLDDTGAQVLALAAEVSELNQKLDEAEARCETLEKMVKEYQEIIVPGYRERAEKAEMCIDAIEDDLDRGNDNDWAREHIAEWRGQKEE